jgi:uncharacterized protein YndB with AHSA1/START domain
MATLSHDCFYPVSPARLWSALTDADTIGKWLMKNTFSGGLGAKFQLDAGQWGMIDAEITAWEPENSLSYRWCNGVLNTDVDWRLEAEGDGTRLFLQHTGFDLDHPHQRFAFQSMGAGWKQILEQRLAGVF